MNGKKKGISIRVGVFIFSSFLAMQANAQYSGKLCATTAPVGTSEASCEVFINGFLDGALLSDAAIITNLDVDNDTSLKHIVYQALNKHYPCDE